MNLVEKINYAIQSYERSAKAWELKIWPRSCSCCCPRKGDPIITKDEEFTNVKWIAYQL
jgi:hypothetical protein